MRRQLPQVQLRSQFIAFNGGADVVSPPMTIPAGMVREDQNFEQDLNGGYKRVAGYERYDGQASPSDATYAVLAVTLTDTVSTGDVLTDDAETSFGTVVAIADDESYVVLTLITGHFSAGNIKVSSSVVGTCSGQEVNDGASTAKLHAQYKNLAADVYRALIDVVPGSGNILGVWLYDDVVYAFRNNSGGTATAMYKSTTSGWSLVSLGRELSFDAGSAEISEGDAVTGATSSATGTVTRVVLESGSWDGGDAVGRLIFASITGTFQDNENLQVSSSTKAVAASADSAITMSGTGGRFEFVNHNFTGSTDTKRMYGCDGANHAFEFDGTVFVPIHTGMTTDTPSHIAVHKQQLFLSFRGSVQHSAPGKPYVWDAIVGASEIAMGDEVTGFMSSAGALMIATRNDLALLYGSGVADWQLVPFDQEQGAIAYTIQHIGFTLMLDDRGLGTLEAAQQFGNFSSATLSKRIQTWLLSKRKIATASVIVRDKNQYRVFFSDGTALYVTLDNGKVVGMLRQLLSNAVRCACSCEKNDGTEAVFFGSSNGYVYQMEKGTSFDGENIEYFLTTVFNHTGSPRVEKSWRKATFELAGDGYFEFSFTYYLGYAAADVEQPANTTVAASLSAALWDSVNWDQFYWDGLSLSPSEVDLDGDAENISLRIYGNNDYTFPVRISGALLQYIARKPLR